MTVADVKKRLLLSDKDNRYTLSDLATESEVQKLVATLARDAREQACFQKVSNGPRRNIKNC